MTITPISTRRPQDTRAIRLQAPPKTCNVFDELRGDLGPYWLLWIALWCAGAIFGAALMLVWFGSDNWLAHAAQHFLRWTHGAQA